MHAIEVKNVTKIYRKGFRAVKVPAVVECSFTVEKNRITGFVGPNGAGKTTTIKMLNGLVRPTSGELFLHGGNAVEPQSRRGVSYLSEQPYFYSHLTVGEMLQFSAQLSELSLNEIGPEINRVLDLVGLVHKVKNKIRELSKGLQQRLNMAQALLGKPHTFILDEPMSGMDPPGRRLFREIMQQLRRDGCTLFFSTHVLDDIESVCDDVIVLQQGTVTYAGTVRELLAKGYRGTEIEIADLSEKCAAALAVADTGFQKRRIDDGWIIFIEAGGAVEAVQQILNDHQVYPRSIRKSAMTLEELLYADTSKGVV